MKRLLLLALLCVSACSSPKSLTMPFPDGHGTAAAFIGASGDAIIVAGGSDFLDLRPWEGGTKTWLDGIWVIRGNGKSYSCDKLASTLPYAIGGGCSASDGNLVYCFGGTRADGTRSDRILTLRLDGEECVIGDIGRMPEGFIPAAACVLDGNIYLHGSVADANVLFLLDPVAAVFTELAPCPGITLAEGSSLTALHNGSSKALYLVGGRCYDEEGFHLASNVWEYVPERNCWNRKAGFNDGQNPMTLNYSAVVALTPEKLLVFGGDDGAEMLIRDSLSKAGDKEGLARAFVNHPGFINKVFCYDAVADSWELASVSSQPLPAVSAAVILKGNVLIPSGEAHPGVRTNAIVCIPESSFR